MPPSLKRASSTLVVSRSLASGRRALPLGGLETVLVLLLRPGVDALRRRRLRRRTSRPRTGRPRGAVWRGARPCPSSGRPRGPRGITATRVEPARRACHFLSGVSLPISRVLVLPSARPTLTVREGVARPKGLSGPWHRRRRWTPCAEPRGYRAARPPTSGPARATMGAVKPHSPLSSRARA